MFALFLVYRLEAQDLEPRFLSSVPKGGNFAIASYGYSNGNILVDKSLPVEDLTASLHNIAVAYARSFGLFNRLAKFDAIVPYSFGTFSGVVSNIDSSTSRTGFGDPLFRLSIIFIGGEALNMADFIKAEHKKFKMGASFRFRPPLGQYNPAKLINLGANRWAFKTSLAASYTLWRKLSFEGRFSSWFFTENREFFNGNTLSQKPMISAQIHVSYVFRPGIWLAVSMGLGGLGETMLNGVEQNNQQKNSRLGATFAYRFNKHNSIKLAFTSGLSTRYGADFNTVLLAYQFMWFDISGN